MRKHQVDSEFVANNSDRGNTVKEERSESLVEYSVFPSIFPANHSDGENDGSSESNETSLRFSHNSNSIVSLFPPARSAIDSPENYEIIITNPSITITTSFSIPSSFPTNNSDTENDGSSGSMETSPRFSHYSNSIVSFFPPAWSPTESPKNYEIIIRNPSITMTSSFSHFFPLPNGPTRSFSIPLIFPPTMSETETDDSCSESNQSPHVQFSDSIVSLFPLAGSQTDSSSSKNYEIIIPNNPSISTRPKSNNSSKSNRTPTKFSHSVLSFCPFGGWYKRQIYGLL